MELTKKDLTISQPLSSIYLLYGKHTYLIQLLTKKITDQAVPEAERDFNLSVYDMETNAVQTAVEDANTLPFMGDKRVVVLENPVFLTNQQKKLSVEHDEKTLMHYLESPSPDTVLIITASFEKLDKRKKLVKQLQNTANVLEMNKITDQLMFDILKDISDGYDTTYTKEAHDQLTSIVGSDMEMLVSEVKKLALYCDGQQPITPDVVSQLTPRSLEQNVFELVDRVMSKDLKAAYQILDDMFKQKQEPIRLLALIARQFRLAFQVSLYLPTGYSQQQIAQKLSVHPYAIKVASNQSRRFNSELLTRALDLCTETDYRMKKGLVDKHLGLELCIHQLASLQSRKA
ncbi:DNA polymerase III subunit delta [Tuberibacillus sp. Marseille-P3662]|uniref:DNA polymerase III subunit delta n=1 Tax=Tuberibacillus sp. Marseille-P3662 TaxID=1965358 RepID=UPI000A1C8DB4|nr:DNA polymerase III subunit delta [Tuberibacillus sp. Marseille-P3662]